MDAINKTELENCISSSTMPAQLSELQQAIWHMNKGNWDEAHEIVQGYEGQQVFDHLHAWLHRVEGDKSNAGYWYRRAGINFPDFSLSDELNLISNKYWNS